MESYNKSFERELKEAVWLATSYASNFYNIKSFKDVNKFFKEQRENTFQFKCHEGYKKAQKIIIKNILLIEEEIKKEKNNLKEYTKGKKEGELKKDKIYRELKRKINNLDVQKLSFQEVANVIVWTLFGMQRINIKSFLQKDGGAGFLKDRDIETIVEIADDINKKDNEFALISDITSCIHLGDLIIIRNNNIEIMEVKQSSEMNNMVQNVTRTFIKDGKINKKEVDKIKKKSPKHGLKQLKRSFNQMIKMGSTFNYIKTGIGYDWNLKQDKQTIELKTPDVNNLPVLTKIIKDFYSNNNDKNHTFFILDCLIVGIFKNNKKNEPGMANILDFKHHIYHSIEKSWGDCQYGKDISKENFRPEIVEYISYKIYSLRNLISIPTHMPLFFLLPIKYGVDLIMDKISIYIYFDINKFLYLCKKEKLPIKLCNKKEAQKIIKTQLTSKYYPVFDNKFLCLQSKKINQIIAYGLLFKIIYEFQSAKSIIKQQKEDILLMEHPFIYKMKYKIIKCVMRLGKKYIYYS